MAQYIEVLVAVVIGIEEQGLLPITHHVHAFDQARFGEGAVAVVEVKFVVALPVQVFHRAEVNIRVAVCVDVGDGHARLKI